MARAHGARAQMALAFETVYGSAPTTGFRTVPFVSTTLGSEQPLIASELLGQGRDPLAPIKDAVTADGDVVVPIDVENFGLWLKAAFRAPTTSGTTPKTHTFQSGSWSLPSLSIETAMRELGKTGDQHVPGREFCIEEHALRPSRSKRRDCFSWSDGIAASRAHRISTSRAQSQ